MADDRERNQGMKRDSGGHNAPARNPQDDRSTGQRGIQHGNMPGQGSQQGQQPGRRGGDFDPSRGGDGGSYKQGGQNEQNTRR